MAGHRLVKFLHSVDSLRARDGEQRDPGRRVRQKARVRMETPARQPMLSPVSPQTALSQDYPLTLPSEVTTGPMTSVTCIVLVQCWGGGADGDLRDKEEAGTQVVASCGGRDLSGQSIRCVFLCWEELWVSRVHTTLLRSTGATLFNNHSYWAYVPLRCGPAPGWEALVLLSFPCYRGRNGFRDIRGRLGREQAGDRVVWVQCLLHRDLGGLCIYDVFLPRACWPTSICF